MKSKSNANVIMRGGLSDLVCVMWGPYPLNGGDGKVHSFKLQCFRRKGRIRSESTDALCSPIAGDFRLLSRQLWQTIVADNSLVCQISDATINRNYPPDQWNITVELASFVLGQREGFRGRTRERSMNGRFTDLLLMAAIRMLFLRSEPLDASHKRPLTLPT